MAARTALLNTVLNCHVKAGLIHYLVSDIPSAALEPHDLTYLAVQGTTPLSFGGGANGPNFHLTLL